MSYWHYCKPLQSPFVVRKPPENVGSRRAGKKPDTITVCNFQVKRRRPEPYVSIVDEVVAYLNRSVPELKLDVNLFPHRLYQRVADSANPGLFVDSLVNLPPRSFIGKALKHEYPRIQLIGVSHDEAHQTAAENLVQSAYLLLGTTFTREIGV